MVDLLFTLNPKLKHHPPTTLKLPVVVVVLPDAAVYLFVSKAPQQIGDSN